VQPRCNCIRSIHEDHQQPREKGTSIERTNLKDGHHTQAHPKTRRAELKSNKTERMITIRTLGWNFTLYARGTTEEQEAMTFYNVFGPFSMLEIRAKAAEHSH
jgi:hypothetical protein